MRCPGYGGTIGFCWFEDDRAALDWLRHDVPRLYGCDDADSAAYRVEIDRLLADVTRLEDLPVKALNLLSTGLFEIRWAGSFVDLMFGDHPFAREAQADFHTMAFPDERGQGPMGIIDKDFATHLLKYHEG